MKTLFIPRGYKTDMDIRETEVAIKKLKDFFEVQLAKKLNLTRVSAPLFVRPETGLNDELNGIERRVGFTVKGDSEASVEIVQSLAKWKRTALKRYGFVIGEGIYTDMNAIRRDEDLDNLHSIYVDQWDWEKVIGKYERTEETLRQTVTGIYEVLKGTADFVKTDYPWITHELPESIHFITTQELEDMYPTKSAKEREDAIAKEKKAVFIMKIGDKLESGEKHDGRASDYDDWKLNGDIIVWNDVLERAFELSSMGIRVDREALLEQVEKAKEHHKLELDYHKAILDQSLPFTIGGGIGQSRLCMYFLKKAHIGEVQASIWPKEMEEKCFESGIRLL